MTVNELTKIWAKIKALFAPKSDVTALETKINNIIDANGKVKSDVLPSYVDDVVDAYYNDAVLSDGRMYTYNADCQEGQECVYTKGTEEIPGESGKIYYAVNNKKIYRFNEGTGYFFEIVDEPDLTNYYTKTEADAKFAAIDDIVEGGITQAYADTHYAPINTTYSKSEVDSEILNSTSIVCGFYKNDTTFKPGSYESGMETYTEDYNTLLAKENILYVDVKDHKIYYYDVIQRKYIALNELTAAQIDEICVLDDSGSSDGEPDEDSPEG